MGLEFHNYIESYHLSGTLKFMQCLRDYGFKTFTDFHMSYQFG